MNVTKNASADVDPEGFVNFDNEFKTYDLAIQPLF